MAQTQSSNYFTGLRDDLTGLVIDYGRARYIDSQTVDEEMNVPDQSDVRAGMNGADAYQAAPGGVSIQTWLILGAAAIGGFLLLKQAG